MDIQLEALSEPCKRAREMNILTATLGWTPSAVAATVWNGGEQHAGGGRERHAGEGRDDSTSSTDMGRI